MTVFPDEHGLLGRCVDQGDEAAWESFVSQYSRFIWSAVQKAFNSYFFRFSQEDVEDVFNAVFLSLIENDFRKLRQFRGENSCSLSTYLTVVTVRMSIDFMRRDKSYAFVETCADDGADLLLMIPDNSPSAFSVLEEQGRRKVFAAAVEMLPVDDRMLFALFCRKDCPAETVAGLLGMPVEAVYTRKNRIIGKLKKIIEEMQENPARSVK